MHADLRQLLARYLLGLAHLCHTPPPVARKLRLGDFAALIDGIDVLTAPRGDA